MRSIFLLAVSSFIAANACAEQPFRDVIYRQHGGPLTGRVAFVDTTKIECEVSLIEGQPPARLTLPRAEVTKIVFAIDERLEAYLKNTEPKQIDALTQLWKHRESMLSLPESNAGEIGLVFAEAVLNSGHAEESLRLYQEIEKTDWSAERARLARNGKLQAKLKLGRLAEAVEEAREIEKANADPASLIEAKFILAEAGFQSLKKLLGENPRWKDDPNVLPECNRIYHETIDLYLYPFLFHGSEQAASARGLWRAVELYQLVEDITAAREAADDIVNFYPSTLQAPPAREFLKNHLPTD